jgi:hypothetical protein
MKEELKKEWESSFDKEFNLEQVGYETCVGLTAFFDEDPIYNKVKSFISSLLAKQQSEATRTARNELMANFEENRENWLKYADKKVAEAQEEFVKCLPEEKEIPPFREDKKTISRDELLMRTAYNQCIADIKSKLNI